MWAIRMRSVFLKYDANSKYLFLLYRVNAWKKTFIKAFIRGSSIADTGIFEVMSDTALTRLLNVSISPEKNKQVFRIKTNILFEL